jgi:hypothetical protein
LIGINSKYLLKKKIKKKKETTRVPCGFSSVNLSDKKLDDRMDSYFLSETLKYLYLIFDDSHWVSNGNYLFTTEGHIFSIDEFYKSSKHPPPPSTVMNFYFLFFLIIFYCFTNYNFLQGLCDLINSSDISLLDSIQENILQTGDISSFENNNSTVHLPLGSNNTVIQARKRFIFFFLLLKLNSKLDK